MLFNLADFTSDFATPLEAAETVDAGLDRPRLVAAPAAEQLAALDPRRRAVTLAAHRTQRSRVPVGLTVIGGFFRVNQIFPTWWFDGRAFGNDRLSVISCSVYQMDLAMISSQIIQSYEIVTIIFSVCYQIL